MFLNPGKFSTSSVVVNCPPAAMPRARNPSYITATLCSVFLLEHYATKIDVRFKSALAAYIAAVWPAGPELLKLAYCQKVPPDRKVGWTNGSLHDAPKTYPMTAKKMLALLSERQIWGELTDEF